MFMEPMQMEEPVVQLALFQVAAVAAAETQGSRDGQELALLVALVVAVQQEE
jgi:hypothetical protein